MANIKPGMMVQIFSPYNHKWTNELYKVIKVHCNGCVTLALHGNEVGVCSFGETAVPFKVGDHIVCTEGAMTWTKKSCTGMTGIVVVPYELLYPDESPSSTWMDEPTTEPQHYISVKWDNGHGDSDAIPVTYAQLISKQPVNRQKCKITVSLELDNGTMPEIADYLEAVATGLRNRTKKDDSNYGRLTL